MAKWSKRRWAVVLIVAAALGFILPPFINLNRFRGSIAQSMSQALGREVTVGAVNLRLLPEPGFDLQNLVISDDPAFGAEPILRADAVTATFRLSSLWRGRLEIASLRLKTGADINPPSLNLVRSAGRWNIEALLARASQTPSAPTTQSRAEVRPRFPYIEAKGGRINFKIGPEKTVYVLTDADFALSLVSENEWEFRLAARPVRIDSNMNDTGMLRVSGRFRRSPTLRDTPLDVRVTLQDAQLGALTKLAYGHDRGWRGTVQANARLVGTPAALSITAQTSVSDFRRYDINSVDPLRLHAQCSAQYSTVSEKTSDIDCQMPLDNGVVLLRGNVQGLGHDYDLDLSAETVGIQSVVILARHAKKDIPDDLSAGGNLDFALNLHKDEGSAAGRWSGGGRTSEISLRSSVLTPDLALPPLGFTVEEGKPQIQGGGQKQTYRAGSSSNVPGSRVVFAAFRVPLGAATPVNATAWLSREEYEFHAQGDVRIPRLLQAGRAIGLRVPQYKVDGGAHIDLHLAGSWMGFSAPQVTGMAQLHEISAPVQGLNAPLQIAGADLRLEREAAGLQRLTLRFPGSPLQLTGSIRLPRNCASPEQCPLSFDLQADEISLDEVNRLVNPALAKHAWYNVFSRSPASVLMRIRAAGHLSVGRLLMKSVPLQRASADVKLEDGMATLANVRAHLLGGQHLGEWHVNFAGDQVTYSGSGKVSGVDLPSLASLMHDNWAAGGLDADYHISMSGTSAAQLAASANGTFNFDWRNGVLRHIALDGSSGPLQFRQWTGKAELRNGTLTLAPSQIQIAGTRLQASGTASLGRELNLKLRNGSHAYVVLGPLEKPKVTAASSETQAALQP